MRNFVVFILLVFWTGISNAQEFEIKAKLTGFKDGTQFYLEDADLETYIDSAQIKDNLLVFKGKLKFYTPKLLFIYHFQDEDKEGDEESVWANLFIGNEQVEVTGDKKDFPFFLEKTGSKYQDVKNKLDGDTRTREMTAEWYDLHLRIGNLQFGEEAIDSVELKANKHKMDSLAKIIKPINDGVLLENMNSYAALSSFYYSRSSIGKDSLQKLYNKLDDKYKRSVYGKRIQTYIKVGDIMEIGDDYLDFQGKDKEENLKKLSDFIGEKYVLIDFMQAFCPACVVAEKELKYIDGHYKEQLQIISYSKDKMEEDWRNGLQRDKPNWPSLWNGEGYFGETAIKYGAQGSPTFVLLSPRGKIIDKWVGFQKGQLKEKVAENLEESMN